MLLISTKKLFPFSRYLNGHAEKWLNLKDQVIFKIYDVTTWLTITVHILTNISRSKDNNVMKFGQLLEYNMRNIFLENLYSKCGGETIPRSFSKKSRLNISLGQ